MRKSILRTNHTYHNCLLGSSGFNLMRIAILSQVNQYPMTREQQFYINHLFYYSLHQTVKALIPTRTIDTDLLEKHVHGRIIYRGGVGGWSYSNMWGLRYSDINLCFQS